MIGLTKCIFVFVSETSLAITLNLFNGAEQKYGIKEWWDASQ
jgi:hypothetical protein